MDAREANDEHDDYATIELLASNTTEQISWRFNRLESPHDRYAQRRSIPPLRPFVLFLIVELIHRGVSFRVYDAFMSECGRNETPTRHSRTARTLARSAVVGKYVRLEASNGISNTIEFRRQPRGEVTLAWKDEKRTTDLCVQHRLPIGSFVPLDDVRAENEATLHSSVQRRVYKVSRLYDFSVFMRRCGDRYIYTSLTILD